MRIFTKKVTMILLAVIMVLATAISATFFVRPAKADGEIDITNDLVASFITSGSGNIHVGFKTGKTYWGDKGYIEDGTIAQYITVNGKTVAEWDTMDYSAYTDAKTIFNGESGGGSAVTSDNDGFGAWTGNQVQDKTKHPYAAPILLGLRNDSGSSIRIVLPQMFIGSVLGEIKTIGVKAGFSYNDGANTYIVTKDVSYTTNAIAYNSSMGWTKTEEYKEPSFTEIKKENVKVMFCTQGLGLTYFWIQYSDNSLWKNRVDGVNYNALLSNMLLNEHTLSYWSTQDYSAYPNAKTTEGTTSNNDAFGAGQAAMLKDRYDYPYNAPMFVTVMVNGNYSAVRLGIPTNFIKDVLGGKITSMGLLAGFTYGEDGKYFKATKDTIFVPNGDDLTTATWTEAYKVTFDNARGNVTTKYVAKDTAITAIADPVGYVENEEAYLFDYWRVVETGTAFDFAKPVTADTNLVAAYRKSGTSYDVTFKLSNEDTGRTVKVAEGSLLPAPETPTKEAPDGAKFVYVFDGWYNGETKWDLATDLVTEAVTLVARFNQVNLYTVTFNGENAKTVKDGDKLTAPATPTHGGEGEWVFDGWYNGDTKWNFDSDTVTDDTNLVAKFIEVKTVDLSTLINCKAYGEGNNNTYFALYMDDVAWTMTNNCISMSYDVRNLAGTGVYGELLKKLYVNGKSVFELNSDDYSAIEGHATTQGAVDANNDAFGATAGEQTQNQANRPLCAPIRVDVFLKDGISMIRIGIPDLFIEKVLGGKVESIEVKTGFAFDDVHHYTFGSDVKFITNGAVWGRPCTVTIGETTMVVPMGATLVEPETPTKEAQETTNYQFIGWFNGETKWDFASKVAGDMTLTAKFAEAYYVTFDGEYETLYVKGEKVEAIEDPFKSSTVSTVYTFDGWYLGEKKWDFETDTVQGPTALVAKYIETARKYQVTFDGENAIEVAYGEKVTKPADPTKTGYVFDFWAVEGEETAFDFENATIEGNLALVSKWKSGSGNCLAVDLLGAFSVITAVLACAFVLGKRK